MGRDQIGAFDYRLARIVGTIAVPTCLKTGNGADVIAYAGITAQTPPRERA
jgi:hypothetical protein